jgi:hypothetical protein
MCGSDLVAADFKGHTFAAPMASVIRGSPRGSLFLVCEESALRPGVIDMCTLG